MADQTRLDFLLTLKLPLVETTGRRSVIRFADVPKSLRGAFESFIIYATCPMIDGERCAFLDDWKRFIWLQKLRCHSAMKPGSRAMGARGPR